MIERRKEEAERRDKDAAAEAAEFAAELEVKRKAIEAVKASVRASVREPSPYVPPCTPPPPVGAPGGGVESARAAEAGANASRTRKNRNPKTPQQGDNSTLYVACVCAFLVRLFLMQVPCEVKDKKNAVI